MLALNRSVCRRRAVITGKEIWADRRSLDDEAFKGPTVSSARWCVSTSHMRTTEGTHIDQRAEPGLDSGEKLV
jgi:hypothetical protein